jgi:hypothetical protein
MSLRKIGSNQTEIETITGNVVLYSYSTPVAACLNGGRGFIRTNKRYSVTTSKHITQWLNGAKAVEVEQSVINRLVGL